VLHLICVQTVTSVSGILAVCKTLYVEGIPLPHSSPPSYDSVAITGSVDRVTLHLYGEPSLQTRVMSRYALHLASKDSHKITPVEKVT